MAEVSERKRGAVAIWRMPVDDDDKRTIAGLLRKYDSSEKRIYPNFRKSGLVTVEVDVEEWQAKGNGQVLFYINAEGTDFEGVGIVGGTA